MKLLTGKDKEYFDEYFFNEENYYNEYLFNTPQNANNSINDIKHKSYVQQASLNRTKVKDYSKPMPNTTNYAKKVRTMYKRAKKGGFVNHRNKAVITGAKTVDGKIIPHNESYNDILNSFLLNKDYSNIYFCSDTNFFKKEIKNKINNYKETEKLMKIFKHECEKLSPDDILIFLGNIGDYKTNPEMNKRIQELLKSCQCNKVLIKGNNDLLSEKYYKDCGFIFIEDYIIYESFIFTSEPIDISYFNNEGIKFNIHGDSNYIYSDNDHFNVYNSGLRFISLNDIYKLLRK